MTTNNKRQIILHCRHGYKRASESTGTRTKLRYNYLGCNAKISCYKPSGSNRAKITAVNLEHNHEVSKAAFQSVELTEKEKEVVVDLHEGNCKVSQICRVLKNFDKKLSLEKLRNMIRKLSPKMTTIIQSDCKISWKELKKKKKKKKMLTWPLIMHSNRPSYCVTVTQAVARRILSVFIGFRRSAFPYYVTLTRCKRNRMENRER